MMKKNPLSDAELVVLNDSEHNRYASLQLIPWWDQTKLTRAYVMVVGAGALGNEVLKNLALLGIGHLFIVDFDRIEISNLTRSVLFRAKDAGRFKARVAAERVHELNPDVQAHAICRDLVYELGLGIFRRMDVIIGCLDNREARWVLNRVCWHLGKPWVDGGLNVLGGNVKVFIPPDGACYECGLSERDMRQMMQRYSCLGARPENAARGRVPTTITDAAIIAGVQVQEVLKLLHGQPITPGSSFLYDGLGNQGLPVHLARRADCLAHEIYTPIIELDASIYSLTFADLLRAAQVHLGDGAYLSLDRQLVVGLTCPSCHATESLLRPYWQESMNSLACPFCAEIRTPEITHIIHQELPHLETHLVDAGIPPFHIVQARNSEQVAYLELTADAGEMFVNTEGD